MKSQQIFILLCLFIGLELNGQSFQEAFHPHYALAQRTVAKNASNYGSQSRLSSSVSIGYQPGIHLKEEAIGRQENAVSHFQITQSQKPMVLNAKLTTEDVGKYHLLLTNKRGAFLENFPLQQSTTIDCRHLRNGSYKILLCSRNASEPIRQFKLTKY